MKEQGKSRNKILGFFWLRCICFCVLAFLTLAYATYVLTPKHDFGICSMINYYRQTEDTVYA